MTDPEIVFAGDREIAVRILEFINESDATISALLLPNEESASHDEEVLSLCKHLDSENVLRGETFRAEEGKRLLTAIEPDYIISIHFQYIYPKEVLNIPTEGAVNLHPAYLPYNRGWHTPSWAILDETPFGATLHFMEEEVDAGDIIARKELDIKPDDTADSLYGRARELEIELFKESWPSLATYQYETQPQSEQLATEHKKADIEAVRKIETNERYEAKALLRKLRALTTNRIEEAAYFEQDGKKYRVQVNIVPEEPRDEE